MEASTTVMQTPSSDSLRTVIEIYPDPEKRRSNNQLLHLDLLRRIVTVRDLHTRKIHLLDLPDDCIPRCEQFVDTVQLGTYSAVSDLERDLQLCHEASTNADAFSKIPKGLITDKHPLEWTSPGTPWGSPARTPVRREKPPGLPLPTFGSDARDRIDHFSRLPDELMLGLLNYTLPRDQAALHRVNSKLMKIIPKPVLIEFMEFRGARHWLTGKTYVRRVVTSIKVSVYGSGKRHDNEKWTLVMEEDGKMLKHCNISVME